MTPLEPAVRAIESARFLDPVAKAAARTARTLISGPVKDALSGTWLGHAVHPLLTDVVIGTFPSATLLDLLGRRRGRAAAERLIAVGIAAYGPTALTGVSDWADSEPAQHGRAPRGPVHAGSNAVTLSLYAPSLVARAPRRPRPGVLLGALGASALAAGAYLGGHLTLGQGVGTDQTVFDPGPAEWTPAADASVLHAGRPTRVVVQDTPVLLLRDGELIFAVHDRCSHRGCSLSEGELDGDEIVCPCHGSRFDRRDGSIRRGPATAPQPAFQVRDRDGVIEIRRISSVPS